MKLTQDFECVLPGEIYPTTLKAGEDCPPDLVAHAKELGKLDPEEVEAADKAAAEEAAEKARLAEEEAVANSKAGGKVTKAAEGSGSA